MKKTMKLVVQGIVLAALMAAMVWLFKIRGDVLNAEQAKADADAAAAAETMAAASTPTPAP